MRKIFILSFFVQLSLFLSAQCGSTISTFPYIEDFESGASWTTSGVADSHGNIINDWTWGSPSKAVINRAGSGSKCWVVGGLTNSSYSNGERSYILSPCFDFTHLSHPYIAFKIFWESEYKYDGTNLEYSTNGGTSWNNVGAYGDSVDCLNDNWYNYTNISNLGLFSTGGTTYYALGSDHNGWCGNIQTTSGSGCQRGNGSGGWVLAKHCMSYLGGSSSVQFRFTFGAGTSCNAFDGIAIDSVSISEAPAVTPSFTYSCGSNNQINFSATSNLCKNTYSWDFGDPGSGISNTSSSASPSHSFSSGGSHTVTLTATNTCAGSGTYSTVIISPSLTAAASVPPCPGSQGYVYVSSSVTTGTTYHWSTNPAQNTDTANVSTSGTYTVTATFAGGCSATASTQITFPTQINVSATPVPDTCTSGHGSISLSSPTGGTPGYSYSWSTGAGNVIGISNTIGGHTYSYTVTDAHGCTYVDSLKEPNASSLMVKDSAVRPVSCPGYHDGSAMILVQGGANPYTYHWSPAVSTSSIDTQLSTGSYTVSVTDRVGCVGTVSFSIGSATSISVWAGPDTTLCAGSSITLHVADGYTYLWSNGGTDSAATYTAPAANPVKVRVTKGNCTLTDSVYIYTDSISAFSITASRDSICPTQPDTVVLYGSASGLRPLGYDWSTGHIDSPALHSFIQVYQSGTYTLTVHDGICSVSRTLSIVDGSCDTICQGVFRMPNAFTPNGDGVNEVFKAVYKCSVFDFSLRIYNRWGELVYQGNDVSTGWDGNYKGSTQPGETYMWYACASATKGGVVKCTSGTLEILR